MAGTKRKIAIAKRETKSQRSVAFSKRRQGLFKKASELCRLSGVSVAVLATPPSGKPDTIYSFGHSSVDVVLDAFLSGRRPNVPPPPAETDGCSVGDNIDDPDELRGLIERVREVRNHVVVLLENRAKQNASLERPNSALPVQESDILAGTSAVLAESDSGNGVSAEYSLTGTEQDKNSKTLDTHITGGSVNNDSGFSGFHELEVDSGAFGNFDVGNYILDDGFSSLYPDSALPVQEFYIHGGTSPVLGKSDSGNGVSEEYSLAGTEEEKNSKILETHITGGSVNNDSGFSGFRELEVNSGAFENFDVENNFFDYGFSSLYPDFAGVEEDRTLGTLGSCYNELGVNDGCSAPFGSIDFSDCGFSMDCTEFAAFSYAGTGAGENSRTLLERDISHGGSFGGFGNSGVETSF